MKFPPQTFDKTPSNMARQMVRNVGPLGVPKMLAAQNLMAWCSRPRGLCANIGHPTLCWVGVRGLASMVYHAFKDDLDGWIKCACLDLTSFKAIMAKRGTVLDR